MRNACPKTTKRNRNTALTYTAGSVGFLERKTKPHVVENGLPVPLSFVAQNSY